MKSLASPKAPVVLSILRIATGLVFLQHGLNKLTGFPPDAIPHPPGTPLSPVWFIGVFEATGGVLMILGLFTRPMAFLLSGQMAVAYFAYHAIHVPIAGGGFFPLMNGGDLAIMFSFIFFYLSFSGPGPWSLDAVRASRHREAVVDEA